MSSTLRLPRASPAALSISAVAGSSLSSLSMTVIPRSESIAIMSSICSEDTWSGGNAAFNSSSVRYPRSRPRASIFVIVVVASSTGASATCRVSVASAMVAALLAMPPPLKVAHRTGPDRPQIVSHEMGQPSIGLSLQRNHPIEPCRNCRVKSADLKSTINQWLYPPTSGPGMPPPTGAEVSSFPPAVLGQILDDRRRADFIWF